MRSSSARQNQERRSSRRLEGSASNAPAAPTIVRATARKQPMRQSWVRPFFRDLDNGDVVSVIFDGIPGRKTKSYSAKSATTKLRHHQENGHEIVPNQPVASSGAMMNAKTMV